MTNLLDDCREHKPAEFLTDSARIALLEHCVGVLQDQVASLTQQLIALEASDKQTIRHAMDNDTDIANLRRQRDTLQDRLDALVDRIERDAANDRLTALERQQQDIDPQVAKVIASHAAYYDAQDDDNEAGTDLETLARYNPAAYRNEIAWLSNPLAE